MSGVSRQRERYDDALQLSRQASDSLQPLHDDLAELSPSFDGIVYFAKDQWHENNASAVATVQPRSNDAERFAFYKENIAFRRVDLGATALGQGLRLETPQFIRSRMNPEHHTTLTYRTEINGAVTGGVQAAFNSTYGNTPESTEAMNAIWKKHQHTALEVADAFHTFSNELHSIGDTLELLAPATPNAYIVSWDLRNSTTLALGRYGAVRNYLLDTKSLFQERLAEQKTYTHDTGDGQDIAFWIPETSETFNRANKEDVRGFGKTHILPLIDTLMTTHDTLAESYQDINPHINFVVGLGYVERDKYDGRTSREYWENAQILKTHPSEPVSFTGNAQATLFPYRSK